MYLLSVAARTLRLYAYAVWTGIGGGRDCGHWHSAFHETGDGRTDRVHRADCGGVAGLRVFSP